MGPGSALSDADMVPLLLLPLLWGGSLQEKQGYELRLKESVTVQEGLCVHVPCSFSYPRNPRYSSDVLHIYWYRTGDNIQRDYPVASNNPHKPARTETANRFRLLEDPRTNSCSLSISNARMSDTGSYFFRVERGNVKYSYTDKTLHLQVTALTEVPNIHILGPLESGLPTRLTCNLPGSCEGGRPLTFSWVGVALDSLSPRTLRSSVLNLTLRPRDHGTNLTCQVKDQGYRVITERTILLNVSYAPQNLTICIFRNVTAFEILQTTSPLPILEGQALRLLCAADSNPPAELSWFRGSPALNITPISSTEILELPRVGIAEEGEFTCQARNLLGSPNVSLNLSVHYPAQVSCSWGDKRLHCSCSSRAQPAPSLRWRLREQLLEWNFSNTSFKVTFSSEGPWANSSLSLSEGLSSSLRLSCEAENVHGTQSVTVLLLPGKSVSLAGVVPGALGGAGAMALLSLCSCLIFFCIVKARRKQSSRRLTGVDDEDAVMGTVALGSKQKPQPDSPPEQVPPAGGAPPSGEQQEELHYANLSFHGTRLRDPQDQEATSTCEYSEINTRK